MFKERCCHKTWELHFKNVPILAVYESALVFVHNSVVVIVNVGWHLAELCIDLPWCVLHYDVCLAACVITMVRLWITGLALHSLLPLVHWSTVVSSSVAYVNCFLCF